MKYQIGAILLAFLSSSPIAALSNTPANPCIHSTLPESSATLYETLTKSEASAALQEIATTARTLKSKTENRGELACLAYILGSVDFLRSARGAHRRGFALGAVRWFSYAAAMAPETMSGRQARNRSKASWQRLGTQPDWLHKRVFTTVKLPSKPKNGHIILMPPAAVAERICGTASQCEPLIELPITGDKNVQIRIRQGRYRVGLRTTCGIRMLHEVFRLNGGGLPTVKRPACPVKIVATDGEQSVENLIFSTESGRPILPEGITDQSPKIQVSASGYQPVEITPRKGGTHPIKLTRCKVRVEMRTTPPKSKVDGPLSAPWGRRTLTVSHPGHGTVTHELNIPAPKTCQQNAAFKSQVILPRFVILQVQNEDGEAITLSKLFVDGQAVNPLSFAVNPGRHTFAATHHDFGQQNGILDVNSCLTAECPPKVLTIKFTRSGSRASGTRGPRILYISAGTLFAAGILSGALALSANRQLSSYTDKQTEQVSVAELRDRQTTFARTADALFIGSAASLIWGITWQNLDGEP